MATLRVSGTSPRWRLGIGMAACVLLGGCTALTTDVLVNDAGRPRAPVTAHCGGSEWMDNSMVAVVPIPIFAFASPTQEMNEIKSEDVLQRCGPADRLTNRHVEVDRALCAPLVLTRLISLGVWHWCPADVSWDADVTAPPPPAPVAELAPPRTEQRAALPTSEPLR